MPKLEKGKKINSLLHSSSEISHQDIKKFQKEIEIVEKRDTNSYSPSTEKQEKEGLTGEKLLKMVKPKRER